MITEIGKYRIKPYTNRLCWEIFEYREVTSNKGEHAGKTRMDWVSTGKYPSNYGRALQIVYEMMLMESDEVIEGIEEAIKKAKKIEKVLLKERHEVG